MRTIQVGDYSVSYERKGSGWYDYSVRHAATNRKLFSTSCAVLKRDLRPFTRNDLVTDKYIEGEIRKHAEAELRAYNAKRNANSEAFSRGRADQVRGEKSLPDLPPGRQEEQAKTGTLRISAALPMKLIRDAYDTALKTTQLEEIAEKAALTIGMQVLIGATDEMILKVARRKAKLEGWSDTGIKYVDGIL